MFSTRHGEFFLVSFTVEGSFCLDYGVSKCPSQGLPLPIRLLDDEEDDEESMQARNAY